MKPLRWIGFLGLTLLAGMLVQTKGGEPAFEILPLSADSPCEYQLVEQMLVFTNGAVVRFTDEHNLETVLIAKYLELNQETGEAMAQGAVSLNHVGQLWTGDRIRYNFLTGEVKTDTFRTGANPMFASGVGLRYEETNNVYEAFAATVTTDDVANPSYRIRARRLRLAPGKYIVGYDAVLYLGNIPIFYFPYYKRDIESHRQNLVVVPGYRSLYGPYLLTQINLNLHPKVELGVNLDYRQKRGFGEGPELSYDLGAWGRGEARFYYVQDQDPGTDQLDRNITEDRYRLRFFHRVDARTNLTFKARVAKESDIYMSRDFFETEYRKNIQPKTYFEAHQSWPNFSLSLLAEPRVNSFYETVERLPEIKLTGLRQQLGVSPFYYDSESSVGYYNRRFADNSSSNFAAFRGDTYHQILLPQTFFGWLNITPRAGGRVTYYSEVHGRDLEEQTRTVFNTGAEVSTKLSRLWPDVKNETFQINGLRHILEPMANYVYVPNPSKIPTQLPEFDTELPSYNMIPLDFPDYNAIDSVDSENVLRFGMRNKIQTKRDNSIDNLVNWSLFTDWRIRPRSDQSTLSDLYSDLDLKPRSWLVLNSEIRYEMDRTDVRLANHTATLKPGNRWSVSLGHRYLRDDPTASVGNQTGNNLFLTRIYYRLTENYALQASHHFEARDGVMEEQYYTLYRDMRSWTAGLTLRIRDNRKGSDDITVAVTFSLKAFPRFGLGDDSDNPSLLLGY